MSPTSDSRCLEKIDELYRLRLDQQVALPQLIVAGDQSSGKSSVLEALTGGLPFPRDSGLCTRFPTQIVFKRAPVTMIEVSIMSASQGTDISSFRKRKLLALDHEQFLDIISEACECMGVPKPGQQPNELKSFSSDMLKIELSSPTYDHFSVIDLPGLFRKPTPGHTTAKDIVLVRRMISTFIENPRSIILAVVPGNVDIATQEIVHMAEKADPEGRRTLGVLTKPDLVDPGAEDKVLQLLRHESSNLGYAIVCNRSQKLLGSNNEERNAHEAAFFETSPWNQAPRDRVGISALKDLFDKLLKEITRKSFNGVIHDIESKLQNHLHEIEQIGPARHDPATQRMYLLQLVAEFQTLTNTAILSSYGHGTCFENKDMRLTSLVIVTSENFAKTMAKNSFTRNFRTDHISESRSNREGTDDNSDGSEEEIYSIADSAPDLPISQAHREANLEFSELSFLDMLHKTKPQYCRDDILVWIKREYQSYRSFGIGGLNPSLYRTLFERQTLPWVALSQAYIGDIIVNIHRFLYKLLTYVCKDIVARDSIWTRIVPDLVHSYQIALQQVEFLLQVERQGSLGTLNHYFAENIRKSNETRTIHRLRNLKSWNTNDLSAQPLLRLADVTQIYQSNEDHAIEDIHDALKSYCKVARKRFVDNLYMQVVDCLLITSDKSPLRVLSSAWVGSLSDIDLASIAGETELIRQRRKLLSEEIRSFRKGLEILRG